MNDKILLRLVSIPTISSALLGSWLLAETAVKAQAATPRLNQASCSLPQESSLQSPNIQSLLHRKPLLLVASSSNVVPNEFSADFTEAESDAAVTLFGCDCPACINVLQQFRRQSLRKKGEGHCMTNLVRRGVSQEQVKEILKGLDADTTNKL